MKNVLFFVFLLTFELVLSHQDVQKRVSSLFGPKPQVTLQSTAKALENLEEVGVRTFETWTTERDRALVEPPVSDECENDMKANKIGDAKTGIHYDFQATCYLIGNSNLVLFMKSKTEPNVPTGSKKCAKVPAFQAVFLPQDYNANTYMILNPAMAPWFFTAPLSGCDIFVATNPNQGDRPIVIHSNLNEYQNYLVVNLKLKGATVDEMLELRHPGYQVIARVHYKPLPGEEEDVNPYLEQYKIQHQGIHLISYTHEPPATSQVFHFFGHYDGQWKFILKGEKDGKTTILNVKGNVVTVGIGG